MTTIYDLFEKMEKENEILRQIIKYSLPKVNIDELIANWPSD